MGRDGKKGMTKKKRKKEERKGNKKTKFFTPKCSSLTLKDLQGTIYMVLYLAFRIQIMY